MASSALRKKKQVKKKIKFRRYTFSIADSEKHRYDRLCAYLGIGFRQLTKKALREYYREMEAELPPENAASNENQLDLFEPVDLFGEPLRRNGRRIGSPHSDRMPSNRFRSGKPRSGSVSR